MQRSALSRWMSRPVPTAVVVYLVTTLVYALVSPAELWHGHTPFNHFALLAEAWLHHRLDLGGPPPAHAAGNDFAFYANRWFVAFPGVPALLILPWVAMMGSAEATKDGLFFLLLSGVGPAGMYLALTRLASEGQVRLGPATLWMLTALYAFGTVYFFSAAQGTVWFAAHVVAAGATTLFLYAAIAGRNPLGAGIALALAIGTRPVLAGYALFFLVEWWRARRSVGNEAAVRALVWFGLPVAVTTAALLWHNWARFGNVGEFGYRYLTIAWHGRIEKWGLFDYHYLARNLGVVFTSLPYWEQGAEGTPFRINGHGLALWFTTPVYLWLLWPRVHRPLHRSAYAALGLVAVPSLLYQNTGWVQFGQRFSNDYAPLLILLLALGGYGWGRHMKLATAVSMAVNLFGAVTFGRPEYARFYFIERTQKIIYQPD